MPDSNGNFGFWQAQDLAINAVQSGYDDYGEATLKQMQTAVANGLLTQGAVGTSWSTTLGANKDAWAFNFYYGTPVLGSATLCGCRGSMFVRGPGVVHSDNGDANYTDTVSGWSTVTGEGKDDDYRVHASGTGADKATWNFGVQPAGQYKVLASWVAASSNGSKAPYKVFDGSTQRLSATVNQRNVPSSRQNGINIAWSDLGTVTTTGGVIKVELNNSNAGGNVVADMVRLVPIQPTATASMVDTRERYIAIDQVLSHKHRRETLQELRISRDLVRELLHNLRRARRR
jgi:hypothetical protein